jgi:hypothetical protein
MDKGRYIDSKIQKYVDQHSLRLNEHQTKLHQISMKSRKIFLLN